MKFKDGVIKPGMVIHCPTEEDARALLEHLKKLEYRWFDDNSLNDSMESRYLHELYNDKYDVFIEVIRESVVRITTKTKGNEITEFSSLIESDSDVVPKMEWEFDLKEGCLKGKPVSDSPINSDTGSPMTAEELLEKFRNIDGDSEMVSIFGCTFAGLFDFLSNEEILECFEEYEAAKKAPKPVEVEVGYWYKVYASDTGTIAEGKMWNRTWNEADLRARKIAYDYTKEHGCECSTEICYICHEKEANHDADIYVGNIGGSGEDG